MNSKPLALTYQLWVIWPLPALHPILPHCPLLSGLQPLWSLFCFSKTLLKRAVPPSASGPLLKTTSSQKPLWLPLQLYAVLLALGTFPVEHLEESVIMYVCKIFVTDVCFPPDQAAKEKDFVFSPSNLTTLHNAWFIVSTHWIFREYYLRKEQINEATWIALCILVKHSGSGVTQIQVQI